MRHRAMACHLYQAQINSLELATLFLLIEIIVHRLMFYISPRLKCYNVQAVN
jgi:hypothetical protein